MKVSEFLKLDVSGVMYAVVDAKKSGYMSQPHILVEADRNVVKDLYGNSEVVGFAPKTKRSIFLYIKSEVKESKINSLTNKILEGSDIRNTLYEAESDTVKSDEEIAGSVVDVMSITLKSLGLTVNTAHLSDKYDEFRKRFEKLLRAQHLDLAYKSVVTKKYGIKIGGNASGICSDVALFLWESPWKEVQMTKPEIIDYLKKHKNVKCYTEYKKPYMSPYGHGGMSYAGVKEVDKNEIINTEYGTTSKDMGIGSQASVHISKVKLKKDKVGNLLLTKSLEVWD